jgi:hypothetical protein
VFGFEIRDLADRAWRARVHRDAYPDRRLVFVSVVVLVTVAENLLFRLYSSCW